MGHALNSPIQVSLFQLPSSSCVAEELLRAPSQPWERNQGARNVKVVACRMAVCILVHPLIFRRAVLVLSASSCARASVAASLVRHMPRTEDAELILERLHPSEREKVRTRVSAAGRVRMRWGPLGGVDKPKRFSSSPRG